MVGVVVFWFTASTVQSISGCRAAWKISGRSRRVHCGLQLCSGVPCCGICTCTVRREGRGWWWHIKVWRRKGPMDEESNSEDYSEDRRCRSVDKARLLLNDLIEPDCPVVMVDIVLVEGCRCRTDAMQAAAKNLRRIDCELLPIPRLHVDHLPPPYPATQSINWQPLFD